MILNTLTYQGQKIVEEEGLRGKIKNKAVIGVLEGVIQIKARPSI